MSKIGLYFNTIRKMKPSQIYYRVNREMGKKCSLGIKPIPLGHCCSIDTLDELDFDSDFLNRFDVSEICNDNISLLYVSENFDWMSEWRIQNKSALWNYNLQYCEYLFPLIKQYHDTDDLAYIAKIKQIIVGWIERNPPEKGIGWEPYPVSLRLANWISIYSYIENKIDEDFKTRFVKSMYKQYVYLLDHLEKHLLGNHYLENVKTLIIAATFFNDTCVKKKASELYCKICKEQILDDGMHYELSPMYHKVVLENTIRVAVCLQGTKHENEICGYVRKMLDVAWSFEKDINRVPLFNDGGDNVAKSMDVLLSVCKNKFGITPTYKDELKDSGYYLFSGKEWKLIIDAGLPGPKYNSGHSHCDAMSFEFFRDGKPVVSNCGTYAYQSKLRNVFRGTKAHNTVMVNQCEQNEIWGEFRVARCGHIESVEKANDKISIVFMDYKKNAVCRTFQINEDSIVITDESEGNALSAYFHVNDNDVKSVIQPIEYSEVSECEMEYAPEYGKKEPIKTLCVSGKSFIKSKIVLKK